MYQTKRLFTDPEFKDRKLGSGSLIGKIFVGGLLGSVLGIPGAIVGSAFGAGYYALGTSANLLQRGAEALDKLSKPEYASPLVDTRAAFTMRQASMDAMHNSAFNARAVIGNEASRLHR